MLPAGAALALTPMRRHSPRGPAISAARRDDLVARLESSGLNLRRSMLNSKTGEDRRRRARRQGLRQIPRISVALSEGFTDVERTAARARRCCTLTGLAD
jgi:hypothetical protein